MGKKCCLIFAGLIWGLLVSSSLGFAQEKPAIEQRIAELEKQLSDLKKQYEMDKTAAAKKAKETPVVTASAKEGFRIKSADENFKIKIGGYAQLDARLFGGNKANSTKIDTFAARAVRLCLEGTVFEKYDFFISPEFGATSGSSTVTLADAYIDSRFAPYAKVRAGKFKAPFGLERLQSTPGSTFAEPSIATNLTPNRDIGLQLHGDILKETVNYAVGIFNGVQDNASGATILADTNNDKEVVSRVVAKPFKNTDIPSLRGLAVAGAVSYGHKKDTNANLPSYKTTGQTTFFSYSDLASVSADGTQVRFSPQVLYYYKSFGLMGEYISSQERLIKGAANDTFKNTGWQVGTSYVLTGEEASYSGVVPLKPFDLSLRQWGALELAIRYAVFDIDDLFFDLGWASANVTPTNARALTTGLNWYLSRNVKLVFNYEQTNYKSGATNASRKPENLFLSRFQINF